MQNRKISIRLKVHWIYRSFEIIASIFLSDNNILLFVHFDAIFADHFRMFATMHIQMHTSVDSRHVKIVIRLIERLKMLKNIIFWKNREFF